MGEDTAWGRPQGRVVLDALVSFVEAHPGQQLFRMSMEGVKRIDASFASEAIVELIRRYRGSRGICLVDLSDAEMKFDIDLAAAKVGIPVTVWNGKSVEVIGGQPSLGNKEALEFVLSRPQARAAEFADIGVNISIANASTKLKQLWEQGFIMRSESAAESGGVEFLYRRIG